MSDPQPFPVWLIPLFPLAFVAVWLLATGLIGTVGGWTALAALYPDAGARPRDGVVLRGTSMALQRAMVPVPARYRNSVTLTLSAAGLHLRVMGLFRFRHPPLLIPWAGVERMEPGTVFGRRRLAVHPAGTGARIWLYGRAAEAVEQAWTDRANARA